MNTNTPGLRPAYWILDYHTHLLPSELIHTIDLLHNGPAPSGVDNDGGSNRRPCFQWRRPGHYCRSGRINLPMLRGVVEFDVVGPGDFEATKLVERNALGPKTMGCADPDRLFGIARMVNRAYDAG